MENSTMSMKERIMDMMQKQLETLEVEFDDAERALGRAASRKEKHRTNEDYSDYYDKNMAYDICSEKLNLMKMLINEVSMMTAEVMLPPMARI